jgi:hypothetical protein
VVSDDLRQFDLNFPGFWIEAADRDWAWKTFQVLQLIESLFVEAAAAYSLFRPITADNFLEFIDSDKSPYERCLNGLYGKAFVFALDGIGKLLSRLCEHLDPPPAVGPLREKYETQFGHLKHIRDSAIHLEDRGRGVTRFQKPIDTRVFLLGSFVERRFLFTGEDGRQYEVEVSKSTLNDAKEIVQGIIAAYSWSPCVLVDGA